MLATIINTNDITTGDRSCRLKGIMDNVTTRKLTGLSSEQMNIFCLKKSVECATGFWNQMLRGEASLKLSSSESSALRAKCNFATATFKNVLSSIDQQKDNETALPTFLSENIMTSYLRLALAFCANETNENGAEKLHNEQLAVDILSVSAACLKCIDSGDNFEKLVADFTDGAVCVFSIITKALSMLSEPPCSIGYLLNIIRFGGMYINTLSSMSRKYSNRKKLYATFCTRLLGQCIKGFEAIESNRQSVPPKSIPVLDDFILVVETLIEHSLFFEDKNIEDLASSAVAIEDFSKVAAVQEGNSGAFYRSSSTFKASYHGGFFDALGAMCLEVHSIEKNVLRKDSDCHGYPNGIARLFQVYTKCSYRILAACILIEQNYDVRSSEVISGGKPPSTLHERRKHSMRLLLVSLALVAVVDTVYHRHLIATVGNGQEIQAGLVTVHDKEIERSVRWLISCLLTRKQVLKSLCSSMDATGGSSILATHDSLQGIAQRLHSLCNRSLTGASSPLLTYLSPEMLHSFFALAVNQGIEAEFISPIILEARSVELDCIEIMASIDHRVITETTSNSTSKSARTKTPDSQRPSLVLQAISSAGASSAFSSENLCGERLLRSKEQLLLSVITLYDDLRRMDNFVSEVRSVCHGELTVCSSLFTLLGSQRVQGRLSQAFAALPVSQSELVWSALSKRTSTDGPCTAGSLIDKKCQSLILRALVQATTLSSSSAPARHVIDISPFDYSPQSCDEILQLSSKISLTSPLPQGIIESMGTLLQDSIATLGQLEAEVGNKNEKVGITKRSDEHYPEFLFDIMSLLLQLGAAAIALHRDKSTINSTGESVKEDSWLQFRQNVGASVGLRSVRTPTGASSAGCELGCVSSAAVLLSLSAFIATCDSLKLTAPGSQLGSEGNEGDLEVVTSAFISSEDVDSYVLNMITSSMVGSTSTIPKAGTLEGNKAGAKRKRAETDTAFSSPSIAPTDFLLLLARSVSIWRHLAIDSDTVRALTVAHFKEVSRCHVDSKSHDRGLLLKHGCLCRLMQLATVLDCPIFVSGILLAVQQVIEDSFSELAGLAVESPAPKPRGKSAKCEVLSGNPLPRFTISLLLDTFTESSHRTPGVCMALPVGDLLSAASVSVGPGSVSCLHITARIAHHAAAVISKVLRSAVSNSSSNQILSWTAAAASNSIQLSPAFDEKQSALAAASNVLLLCFQNRPNSSNKNADSVKATDDESWVTVESQLKGVLRPFLSSLGTACESPAHSHLQALAPVLLDFLLQCALSADRHVSVPASDEHLAHQVLRDLSDELMLTLGGDRPAPSNETLRTLVEVYRRICSFYCSLPPEVSGLSNTATEVKDVVRTLLLTVLPKLQCTGKSSQEIVFFDVCCFLAADSLRLYAKYSEDDKESGKENGSDEFLASVILPALPSLIEGTTIELDGWLLLTGTILLLQRRSGNLLSVRGSFVVIEKIRQAVLLAATIPTALHGSSSRADEETLISLSICLQGLITIVPHALRGEVGKMLVSLSQKCASSIGILDAAISSGVSVSCAVLSRYVVMGVDSLLTYGGHHTGDDEGEANSSLTSARAVLESVAVSCTSSAQMLRQPEVVLSLISALRRGITTIQQQQQKGRRKVRRTGVRGVEQQEGNTQDNDPQEEKGDRRREHTLSVWASSCFSILSKIIPRLLKGNGGIKGTESLDSESNGLSDRARVQISAHALNVLEQLFSCDCVGGSSLPLLGNSIGTLGALLTTSMRVILAASEATVDDKERVSPSDALNITNALRVAGRTLTAASSSRELNRHAHILAASVVDMLAQRPLNSSTRELLLPGLFALFDRCKQKQRLQMFATVGAPTRAVLSDLHGTYLRDFKFTGQ